MIVYYGDEHSEANASTVGNISTSLEILNMTSTWLEMRNQK